MDILLIEDDMSDVLMIKRAMAKAQIECDWHHADNGEQAVEMIKTIGEGRLDPALIMLDLNLPRYDGKELLARIRSTPGCTDIPVVVMSGSLNPKDRDDVLASGASMFFSKSMNLEEYMRLGMEVRQLLDLV